jgi:hypothetical protein
MPDPAYAFPAAFRIALAFALGGSALVASRLAPAGISAFASWLWMSGLGIVVAILFPGFSPYFLLPSAIAAAVLLAASGTSKGSCRDGATLFAALVALLVWSSIGTFGEMVMGLKLHPLFTVPFAVALSTLVPLISRCALPRLLWLACTAALFGFAILAAAVQGFEPTFSLVAPERLSITYVQDRAGAEWAADAFAPVPKAMQAVVPFSARPQRISDIAAPSYVAPAGEPRFVPPGATVIARPAVGGRRRVTINLQGSKETAQIYVTIPKGAGLKTIDIGGWHTDVPSAWWKQDSVAIACMSRDCADRSITLILNSRSIVSLGIYEHRFGLPDFAGPLAAARPATAVPSQNGDGETLVNTVTIPASR